MQAVHFLPLLLLLLWGSAATYQALLLLLPLPLQQQLLQPQGH
jgi:hypothetical protein